MLRLFPISFCGVIIITVLRGASADVPPPPPTDYDAHSANGRYIAKVTVDPPMTTVYAKENDKQIEVWSVAIFHPKVFLSNDGQCLAGAFNYLLPAPYSPDLVIIRFLKQGRILREVTIRDLMPDLSRITPTASHYDWGEIGELNEEEHLVVETVDYRELRFDIKTGQIIYRGIRYQDWLDHFFSRLPTKYRLFVSFIWGVMVAACFRGRVGMTIIASFAIPTALLLVELWAIGSLANLGDEWTLGNYSWVTGLTAVWLVPSVLAAAVASSLWRIAKRPRARP